MALVLEGIRLFADFDLRNTHETFQWQDIGYYWGRQWYR